MIRSTRGCRAVNVLFAIVFVAGLATVATTTWGGSDDELTRLLDRLRLAPTDEALIERALRWAERRNGVEPIATKLNEGATEVDLYLAGRFWESAGRGARALAAYEGARNGAMVAPTSARLVHLYLAGGWPEQARDAWKKVDRDALPEEERLRLEYHLAATNGETTRARRIILERAQSIPAVTRAGWARAASRDHEAARLFQEAGKSDAAFHAWLRAGRWAEALTLHTQGDVQLDDISALTLARGLGAAEILETHLGARTDKSAERMRAQLARSLGRAPAANGDAPPVAPTPPVDRTKISDTERASLSPREQAALELIEKDGEVEEAVKEQVAIRTVERPSLLVVAALLELDRLDEARRELTRWRLEPNVTESDTWLPRIERDRPSWFVGDPPPRSLLPKLETLNQNLPSLTARLERAILDADPGSELEAELLFHRGRLTSRSADLERAAAIAPHARVGRRFSGFRLVESIARALERRKGSPPPTEITDQLDSALGVVRGRVVRQRSTEWIDHENWTLESWADAPDPPATEIVPGVQWDRGGAELPIESRTWSAGSIAPLTGVVRLAPSTWLFVGHGLALVDESGEAWRIVAAESLDLARLPSHVTGHLSPALRRLVERMAPPKVPKGDTIQRFLEGVKRRRQVETVVVESVLPLDEQRIVVRVESGERAIFVRGAAPTPQTIPAGYVRRGATWIRTGDTPAPIDASPSPPQAPQRVALSWQRRTETPSRERPDLVVTVRAREFPIPSPETAGPVIRAAGNLPRVIVTGAGRVHFYGPEEGPPRWISHVPTPLPGPNGFPGVDDRTTDAHPAGPRGPHTVGPVADARSPLIAFGVKEFFVVTDRVRRFDFEGSSYEIKLARPFERARDITVDSQGALWVLAGNGSLLLSSHRTIELPDRGAYDVEAIGPTVYVLGFDPEGYWMRAVDLRRNQSERVPLPKLHYEGDREGLRLSALGRWGRSLLLLHEKLYATEPAYADTEWRTLAEWPGRDPYRFPYYRQSAPFVVDDTVVIARPWGSIEGWVGE